MSFVRNWEHRNSNFHHLTGRNLPAILKSCTVHGAYVQARGPVGQRGRFHGGELRELGSGGLPGWPLVPDLRDWPRDAIRARQGRHPGSNFVRCKDEHVIGWNPLWWCGSRRNRRFGRARRRISRSIGVVCKCNRQLGLHGGRAGTLARWWGQARRVRGNVGLNVLAG